MLLEELHAGTFVLCPNDNLSIPVHACQDKLCFIQTSLHATLKTAVLGGFVGWWGFFGWCGMADWEHWEEKEEVMLHFYQGRPRSCVQNEVMVG